MSFTIWFMGRPAAGKSTLAKQVEERIREHGITVENLDGDEIRANLHPDLGFTREDRALNNRRTAFICKLLNQNDIAVVNAMITPFRESQQEARDIVEPEGEFVLVYVNCSLEECERRDPKGLYERARDGKIENFTGVSHPFQEPHNPDIVVDTERTEIQECVEHVMAELHELGLLDGTPQEEYLFNLSRREEADIEQRLTELGYLNDEE